MSKNTLQILIGVAFAVQLTGCFFVSRDDRWHHDHERYHEHQEHQEHHEPSIDVHLHG